MIMSQSFQATLLFVFLTFLFGVTFTPVLPVFDIAEVQAATPKKRSPAAKNRQPVKKTTASGKAKTHKNLIRGKQVGTKAKSKKSANKSGVSGLSRKNKAKEAKNSQEVTKGVAGSIRNVNPTKGTQNCVNCSIATDATLAGRPTSALPGSPTSIRTLEKHFGGKFGAAVSRSEIKNSLLRAGDGARGIVFGSRGNQTGHVFNVVNQKGTIRFLDGQTGKTANLSGFQSLHLLRTN